MRRWLMYSGIASSDTVLRRPEWIQRNVSPCKDVHEGDFVYLVFGGQTIYATGRVERIELYKDDRQNDKWRVTVSQRFGDREVFYRNFPELVALFREIAVVPVFGRSYQRSHCAKSIATTNWI